MSDRKPNPVHFVKGVKPQTSAGPRPGGSAVAISGTKPTSSAGPKPGGGGKK